MYTENRTPLKEKYSGSSQNKQMKDSRNSFMPNGSYDNSKNNTLSVPKEKDYSQYQRADKKMQEKIMLQKERMGIPNEN